MASIDIDSKYGYIEVVSGEFYIKSVESGSVGTNTLNFPMNTIIVKGNSKTITETIGYVYNAFVKIEYSSSNKAVIYSGFSSAAQRSIDGDSNCDLVLKAYTN